MLALLFTEVKLVEGPQATVWHRSYGKKGQGAGLTVH